jgi:hypothetical protein
LRFQIEPTPGESQRACGAIVRASLPPTRASMLMVVLYAVIVAAAWVLTPSSRAMTAVIGVGAALATVSLLQADGRSRMRRLQANDPHARELHYVELDAVGIHTWCGHVDARYPWRDFTKALETREFFLFVRGSGNGAAVPKRVLAAGQDVELRERIREWAPGLEPISPG